MKHTKKSRHLDTPSESNRDKHINFLAQEGGDEDPGADKFGNLFKKENRENEENEDDDESSSASY